jgi:Asp/Glu/hydantoin racemase
MYIYTCWQAWASESGLLDALHRCINASTHVKTCVLNAINSLSRTPSAAQALYSIKTDEILLSIVQEKMSADLNAEQKDKFRTSTAVAVMALANVRGAVLDSKTPAGKNDGNTAVVLEKRIASTIVQICNAAVDGVAFAGTKFSVAAALHALPSLLRYKENVGTMVDK